MEAENIHHYNLLDEAASHQLSLRLICRSVYESLLGIVIGRYSKLFILPYYPEQAKRSMSKPVVPLRSRFCLEPCPQTSSDFASIAPMS